MSNIFVHLSLLQIYIFCKPRGNKQFLHLFLRLLSNEFHFLSKYMPLTSVAIIGSLLVFVLISLPHDNCPVFLTVFLIAYVGRVLVDYAIPVMLIRVVPADIAGIYNAGRNILLNLSSTVSVFAVGALLGKISAL